MTEVEKIEKDPDSGKKVKTKVSGWGWEEDVGTDAEAQKCGLIVEEQSVRALVERNLFL